MGIVRLESRVTLHSTKIITLSLQLGFLMSRNNISLLQFHPDFVLCLFTINFNAFLHEKVRKKGKYTTSIRCLISFYLFHLFLFVFNI